MCTCEGAAFEYTFNVEHELRTRGLRDLADVRSKGPGTRRQPRDRHNEP
jgi:hypothetical protein